MKFKRTDNFKIKVIDKDGGFIDSQSVEANLLFEILKELKKKELK